VSVTLSDCGFGRVRLLQAVMPTDTTAHAVASRVRIRGVRDLDVMVPVALGELLRE